MKKIFMTFLVVLSSAAAVIAIWDRVPWVYKRKYVDTTDIFRRWQNFEK